MPEPTACIWVSHHYRQRGRRCPSQRPGRVCRCHSARWHCPLSAGSGPYRLSTVPRMKEGTAGEHSDAGKPAVIPVPAAYQLRGDSRGATGRGLPSPHLTLPPVLDCSDSSLLSILMPGRGPSQRCQRPHSLCSVAGDSLVSNDTDPSLLPTPSLLPSAALTKASNPLGLV